ncbi:MAG TPA: endonuclease domain-containing protein [Rhodanobacteraceae bacterium]|nr:endonuclease domain-containing protein [Rhodanobacteraceae bacterium]
MLRRRHIPRARSLRQSMTDAEARLWLLLRGRHTTGFKFRRQFPIDRYVADFACLEAKLVVEVDGGQHNDRIEEDAARTRCLESNGFRVLRFWNDEVLKNSEQVLQVIWDALHHPHPGPLPPAGEGEKQCSKPS